MNLHIANISNLASKEDVANHLVQFKPYISDLKLYNNPDVKKRTKIAIIKFKDKMRAESAVDCLTGSILKDQQIFLELEEEKPEEVPREIRISSESSEDADTADGRSLRNGMYKCHGCNKQFRTLPYFSGHLELCRFNQEKLRVLQEQILRKRAESTQERILKNLENNSNHPDQNQNSVEKKQPDGGEDGEKPVKADRKKKKKSQKSAADAQAENAQLPQESENSGSSAEFLSDPSSDPTPCHGSASQTSVTNLTTSLSGSTPSILQPQGSISTPTAPGYGQPAGFPNLLLNQILQTNPALLNNPALMNQILVLDQAQVLGNQQNQLLGNQQNQLLGNQQNQLLGNQQNQLLGNQQNQLLGNLPWGFQSQFPSNLQNPFLGNSPFQLPGNLSNQFPGSLPNQFSGNLLNQFPGNFQNQYSGNPYAQFFTDRTQVSGNLQANFPGNTHPQFPGYLPNQFPGSLPNKFPGNFQSHQFASLQSQLGNLQYQEAGNQVAGNLQENQFNRNLPNQSMNGQFAALNPVMSTLNPGNSSAPGFLQEVNSQTVRKPSLKQPKSGTSNDININKMEDCRDVEGRRHVKFKEPVFDSGEQQFLAKPSLSENSNYRSTEAATNRNDPSSAEEVPSRATFISDGAGALFDGAIALPNEAIALPEEPADRPAVVQDNELILQQV
ncbi:uncharacterized protein LOC111707278 isoform X3 [Eurytemora carolleeae]|uniref:uncharacterized protein LOC111707278 isoform X3 n=1 Tax=Eurytemora carolleeae TaxID=1294199 RepID=UPI000C76B762|nr:uncharacterized protein LOC111707278 isoform X3 [Eurytemora carolleeae]|eukprot:XP_023336125.1 uncharacterized protein LOC111707278 isoform X3 [Eurytemora affinis]